MQIVHFSFDYEKNRDPDLDLILKLRFRKSTLPGTKEIKNKCGSELEKYPEQIDVVPIVEKTEFIFEAILNLFYWFLVIDT